MLRVEAKYFGVGRNRSFIDNMAAAGLLLFSFFSFLGTAGANLGLALIVLSFIARIRIIWPELIRSRVFIWAVVSFLYLVAHTAVTVLYSPEFSETHIAEALKWGRLGIFICIAWWLSENPQLIQQVLILALAGFVIGTLSSIDWTNLESALYGTRSGFHMKLTKYGVISGVAILGLFVFVMEALKTSHKTRSDYIKIVILMSVLAMIVQANITAQARSAWLSLLIALPAVLVLGVVIRTGSRPRSSTDIKALIIIFICIAPVLAINSSGIVKRITKEKVALTEVFSTERVKLPDTSFTVRAAVYQYGLEKWLEKPFFGWGAYSTGRFIRKIDEMTKEAQATSTREDSEYVQLGHFHNTYLEILIRFGVVGLIIILCTVYCIVISLWRAFKAGRIEKEYILFCFGSLLLLAVWSLFDFRITRYDGRFLWYLISGLSLSYSFYKTKST